MTSPLFLYAGCHFIFDFDDGSPVRFLVGSVVAPPALYGSCGVRVRFLNPELLLQFHDVVDRVPR